MTTSPLELHLECLSWIPFLRESVFFGRHYECNTCWINKTFLHLNSLTNVVCHTHIYDLKSDGPVLYITPLTLFTQCLQWPQCFSNRCEGSWPLCPQRESNAKEEVSEKWTRVEFSRSQSVPPPVQQRAHTALERLALEMGATVESLLPLAFNLSANSRLVEHSTALSRTEKKRCFQINYVFCSLPRNR